MKITRRSCSKNLDSITLSVAEQSYILIRDTIKENDDSFTYRAETQNCIGFDWNPDRKCQLKHKWKVLIPDSDLNLDTDARDYPAQTYDYDHGKWVDCDPTTSAIMPFMEYNDYAGKLFNIRIEPVVSEAIGCDLYYEDYGSGGNMTDYGYKDFSPYGVWGKIKLNKTDDLILRFKYDGQCLRPDVIHWYWDQEEQELDWNDPKFVDLPDKDKVFILSRN